MTRSQDDSGVVPPWERRSWQHSTNTHKPWLELHEIWQLLPQLEPAVVSREYTPRLQELLEWYDELVTTYPTKIPTSDAWYSALCMWPTAEAPARRWTMAELAYWLDLLATVSPVLFLDAVRYSENNPQTPNTRRPPRIRAGYLTAVQQLAYAWLSRQPLYSEAVTYLMTTAPHLCGFRTEYIIRGHMLSAFQKAPWRTTSRDSVEVATTEQDTVLERLVRGLQQSYRWVAEASQPAARGTRARVIRRETVLYDRDRETDSR